MATNPTTAPPPGTTDETSNFWTNLSDRERRLVGLMLTNFVILGVAVGIYLFNQSQDATRSEITQYEETLDALREYGPTYLKRQQAEAQGGAEEAANKFSADKLTNNDLALTSFVATQASAVDIKIDNYDEDSLPMSSNKDSGPIITEKQLRIDIREAELAKLMKMLDRIEKSPEPVVIKRINMRDVRNKPGHVRANVTISTYVQKSQEE